MKYNNKKQKFSVRKLTVGTASVFLGATVVPSLVDLPQELVSVAKASEESATEESVTNNSVEAESSVEKANTYNLSSLIEELETHASGSPVNTEFVDSELVSRYMSERESSVSILDYAKNILYSGENITSEQVKQLEEQLTTKLNNLKKLEAEIEEQNNRTYDDVDKSNLYNLLEEARKNKNYDYEIFDLASEELKNEYWDIERRFNDNDTKTIKIINSNKYSEEKVREQENMLREISTGFIKVKEKIYSYVDKPELTAYKKQAVEEINNHIDKVNNELSKLPNIADDSYIEKVYLYPNNLKQLEGDYLGIIRASSISEINKIKYNKINEATSILYYFKNIEKIINDINNHIDKLNDEIDKIDNLPDLNHIKKLDYDYFTKNKTFSIERVLDMKKDFDRQLEDIKYRSKTKKEIENYVKNKEELKGVKFVDYVIYGINSQNIYNYDKLTIFNTIDNNIDSILEKDQEYKIYNKINNKLGFKNEYKRYIIKNTYSDPGYDYTKKDLLFNYVKNNENEDNKNNYEYNYNDIKPRNNLHKYKEKLEKLISDNNPYDERFKISINGNIIEKLELYDRRLDAILNLEDRIREDIIAPYNELPENEKIENKGNTETAINLKQKISELANKLYDKLDNTNLDNQEDVEKLKAEIRAEHLNVEKYVANALISNEKYALNNLRDIRSSRTELDYNKPLGNYNYALKDEFNTDEIVTSAQESINNANSEEEIKAIKDKAITKIKEKNLNLYKHRAINQIEKDLLNIKQDINNLQQISLIEKQKYKDILDEMLDNYKKKIMASSSTDYHHKMVSFISNNLRNSYIEIIKDYLEKEIKNEPNVTNKTSESVAYYNKKLSSAKNKLEEISTFIKAKKNNVKEEPDLAFKYDKNYDVHKTFDNSHHYTEIIKEAIEEKIVLETAKLMLEELPNTDSNSSNLNVTTNTSINVNPRLEVDKNNNANNTNNNIIENSNNIDDKVNANNELNSNNTSENNNINVPNNNSNNVLNSASDNISNNNNSNNINQKDKNINSNNSEVPKGINLNNNISNINSNNNLSTNKDSVSIKNNSTKEINANNLETNNKQSSVSINSNNELKTDRAKTDKKIDSNYNYSEQKINNKLLPNTGLNNTNSNYMAVATILASIYLAARKQKSNK